MTRTVAARPPLATGDRCWGLVVLVTRTRGGEERREMRELLGVLRVSVVAPDSRGYRARVELSPGGVLDGREIVLDRELLYRDADSVELRELGDEVLHLRGLSS